MKLMLNTTDKLFANNLHMENKYIVTIDLGTCKLGVSVARNGKGGNPEIISYREYPSDGISHGKVINPTRLGSALKDAIEETERVMGIRISRVAASLQKCDVRQVEETVNIVLGEGHCISDDDIKGLDSMVWDKVSASLETGEEVIGEIAQCFNTGEERGISIHNITGMMGESLEGKYKVFVGRKTNHNNIDTAFKIAGIDLVPAIFEPQKTGESILTATELHGGVALFDMGAGASSVSIFSDGVLRYYGAIPFGGCNITSDIRDVCGISEHLAENIKKGYGGCMPDRLSLLGEKTIRINDKVSGSKIEVTAKYLSEIVTARAREIVEALLYLIQESGYADRIKYGITITGGGALLLNMAQMIKEMSGYSVRLGAPSQTRIEATSDFYTAGAGTSAGLVMGMSNQEANDCASKDDSVEKADSFTQGGSSSDLFNPEENGHGQADEKQVADNWFERTFLSGKDRKEGEKQQNKEKKSTKKAAKDTAKKSTERTKDDTANSIGLFGMIFGDNDDEDNKI